MPLTHFSAMVSGARASHANYFDTDYQVRNTNIEEETHCYVVQCRRICSLWAIRSRLFNN